MGSEIIVSTCSGSSISSTWKKINIFQFFSRLFVLVLLQLHWKWWDSRPLRIWSIGCFRIYKQRSLENDIFNALYRIQIIEYFDI